MQLASGTESTTVIYNAATFFYQWASTCTESDIKTFKPVLVAGTKAVMGTAYPYDVTFPNQQAGFESFTIKASLTVTVSKTTNTLESNPFTIS